MPYWDVVTRSFVIAWRHKYLWLIAFFSGEAGGSLSFNSSQGSSRSPDAAAIQEQVTTWINQHVALLVGLGVLSLVLLVVFFILGAICEGATVRASAEHDADRPFGLRQAWTAGVHTLWVIVRFRLLIVLLYLPLWILIAAWLVFLVLAIVNGNGGAIAILAASGLLLLVVFFVYAVYLFFIDRYGARAAILEQRGAVASLVRAHRLLVKRFGRSLVVWVLAVAVGLVTGILLFCVSAVLALPLAIALFASAGGGSGAVWVVVALTLIVLIPIYVVVYGFLGAQGSTYWTLAFRRLDVDYPPAYPYRAA